MSLSRFQLCQFLLLLCATSILPAAHADEAATWAALDSGNQVVLIRHASTEPGVGDPAGFTLDDCTSQRKLSAEGRAQAQRLGEQFRQRRIPVGQVWSSSWCRCTDTATLAFGQVKTMAMLDSSFDDSAAAVRQKRLAVAAAVRAKPAGVNLVMVTHQVNITELTGVVPRMGEVVVVSSTPKPDGTFAVVGRLQIP
ncbi:histidine phosphatase family protein [Actimicrobium antarcticum]|uniref:Histidine phosphatase family protein n=1 Tax=Actimicrobium antarcticum TaxID=1051899 RepID=A0ABP7STK2_9BURK